jgi:hypothetical protein
MIRSIVRAVLVVAAAACWLVSANVSVWATSGLVSPGPPDSICAPVPGTPTFDLWCGATAAPERPV